MDAVEKATQTQIANIQKKTGKTLDELVALVAASGLSKHGEIRDMLNRELGLGHGDANTLTHVALRGAATADAAEGPETVLDGIYVGAKAALRPIHEAIIAGIAAFGEYETAPKKGYVSLRRKKQFAMVGPATNTRVEVGLNMKGVPGTDRLEAQPPGGMCSHKVKLTDGSQVDAELTGWIKQAFDTAG
jgi:hypothetical protein